MLSKSRGLECSVTIQPDSILGVENLPVVRIFCVHRTRLMMLYVSLLLWLPIYVFGQTVLYQQKVCDNNPRYLQTHSAAALDSATFLVFCTNNSLYTVDIAAGRTSEVDLPDIGLQTYSFHEYIDGKIIGFARSNYSTLYSVTPYGQARALPSWTGSLIGVQQISMSEDGPIAPSNAIDTIWISMDAGERFLQVPRFDSAQHQLVGLVKGYMFAASTKSKYWSAIDRSGTLQWMKTPLRGGAYGSLPISAAISSESVLYWVKDAGRKREFRYGKLGDTVSVTVDSIVTPKGKLEVNPLGVYSLDNGEIVLFDRSGYACKLSGDTAEILPFSYSVPENSIVISYTPRKGYTYIRRKSGDIETLFRIQLTNPIHIDSMTLPAGVRSQSTIGFFSCYLGGLGLSLDDNETGQYIMQPQFNRVCMVGSLTKEISILPWRPMLYSWLNGTTTMVLTDLEQIVRVDSLQRGFLCRGRVQHPDNMQFADDSKLFFPSTDYREWGMTVPASVEGGLVFAGPVVRRISLDGMSTDTLLNAPTSFASVLPNGALATGWKNSLRITRDGITDTTRITIPAGMSADSMGYPSSMIRCADNSLLASFQGTWRRDGSEGGKRLFRWGGILRSSDNGKTWMPQPLPDSECVYVQHIMRTPGNTLLATCVQMIEDSTPAYPEPGTTSAQESSYTVKNVTIMRSNNYGQFWKAVFTPIYNGAWRKNSGNIVIGQDGVLYASLYPGVYRSSDDGATWEADERIGALIEPVSLTVVDDGSLILSANDGVYKLEKTVGVPDKVASDCSKTEVISPNALLSLLSKPTVETATAVDLQGNEVVLVAASRLITDPHMLPRRCLYGLKINGELRLVYLADL